MRTLARSNKGIGLLEILMTMFVLAVGVIGVAGLNSVMSRQSLENKAQAEAQAIAQSRIEQIRNYTNAADSLADFDSTHLPAMVNGNSATINGVYAVFTRTETRVDSGEDKQVQVNVAWTDPNGDVQTVALNTTVSYISPRTIGDGANDATAGAVNAPTGRAELGDGTVPTGATLEPANGDGTTLFEDGEDLKLVDCTNPADQTTCSKIVLTLANACVNDPCDAFAKIQGKVYINTNASGQIPPPSDIHLVASDAAFCARYYMNGTTVVKVGPATTMNDVTSIPNDYRFFSYTCYVGGGWHGNIGIIFKGNGNNPSKGYRGCTGDPLASDTSLTPRVAIRRAYRGLLYKKAPGNTPPRVQINGMDRLYSQGILDGAQLSNHDFVLAKINDVNTECVTAMKGSGSGSPVGTLFAGMPRDFFCLNNGYLDDFDPAIYGHDSGCVFDPTNPPSTRHQISGVVRFTAADNTGNLALANGITVKTSDGNICTNPSDAEAPLAWVHNGTYYETSYTCGVYDWGTQAAPIGWSGDIQLTYDATNVQCTPNKITYAAVQANDTSGNDFTGCSTGAAAVWSGTVTQAGSGSAATKVISTVTMTGTGTSAGVNGTCTVAIGGLSYTCTTAQFFGTWTGNLVFTSGGAPITSGGAVCPATTSTTRTFAVSGVATNYTQDVTIGCDTGVTATWTGTVTRVGNGGNTGKNLTTVTIAGTGSGGSAGASGTCTVAGGGLSYTCTTDPFLGTWTGTLNFTSAGGAICPYVPTAVTTKTYPFSNQSSGNKTQNLTIGRDNGNGC